MSNNWTKCYKDSWKDHIVPEAFSHPAKMSYSLLKRILSHCKDEGWGGVIVDPFGGIGSTGILGAYEGYQVICVELEAKFVNLAKENFELHRKAWEQFGNPYPVIIQGDSRQLCSVVESANIIISSPPYSEQPKANRTDHGILNHKENCECNFCAKNKGNKGMHQGYRQVDIIVSSPPYERSLDDGHPKNKRTDGTEFSYGTNPANLGSMKAGKVDMVISLPPYAETIKGDGTQKETYEDTRKMKRTDGSIMGLGQSERTKGYGCTGNLGNLKAGDVDVILSSPPYEGSEGTFSVGKAISKAGWDGGGGIGARAGMDAKYGNSKGQLGHTQGPIFWQAAKEIVQQCYQILRPGGHAIWVCKDFVRKGQRVPFSDDWQRLCESAGFKTLYRHKAMLVKETKYESLFGHEIVKKTERKSFFRRLAEAKGSPKIDWEDVICMIRR